MNENEVSKDKIHQMGETACSLIVVINRIKLVEESLKTARETAENDLIKTMGQWVIE